MRRFAQRCLSANDGKYNFSTWFFSSFIFLFLFFFYIYRLLTVSVWSVLLFFIFLCRMSCSFLWSWIFCWRFIFTIFYRYELLFRMFVVGCFIIFWNIYHVNRSLGCFNWAAWFLWIPCLTLTLFCRQPDCGLGQYNKKVKKQLFYTINISWALNKNN